MGGEPSTRRLGGRVRAVCLAALSVPGAAGCLDLAGDFVVTGTDVVEPDAMADVPDASSSDDAARDSIAPLCDKDGGSCPPSDPPACSLNAYRCDGAALQVCNGNQDGFTTVTTCSTPGQCNASLKTCAPCVSGQTQCNGATLQTCDVVHGQWMNGQTCATPALCNATGGPCDPPACTAGQFQCVGANLQQCNAGRTGWTVASACATAALCDEKAGRCDTPACNPGQYQCDHPGNLQVCNVTQTGWTLVQMCARGTLCSAGTAQCAAPPLRDAGASDVGSEATVAE
jgi:hypothetical protein